MGGEWRAAVLRKWLAVLLLLAAAAPAPLLAACFENGGTSKPGVTAATPTAGGSTTPQPGSPEEALAAYVRQKFPMEYVGNCENAQLPGDQGKLCTSFRSDRGPMKAYLAGTAFVEFTTWIFMEQQAGLPTGQAGQWQVVGEFPIRPQANDVPGIPWPLTVGAQVVVVGTGQCLNVRDGPGLGKGAIDCLKDGTTIKLAEGPQVVDDFEWWRIDGRDGWVAADWLRYPDATR
jgi:hypothetical protein